MIAAYEQEFDCRLVVMLGVIFDQSVTLFEEVIYDADPAQDLHLILQSPGGDGEAALRIVRSAQARCSELTVIVPNQAKSAGTILALGAHQILMGPASDLGPVDAQLYVPRGEGAEFVAAKDIIAAVESAEQAVQEKPETYPLHAAMLADVTEIMLQQARAALLRTDDLVAEALRSQPERSEEEVASLGTAIHEHLIEQPKNHGAVFGSAEALRAGLPVRALDPSSLQWQALWRLWSKYFVLTGGASSASVYEGRRASRIMA